MALIQCPNCGKTISDRARICPGCGIDISFLKKKKCIECGAEIQEDEAICPVCGCPQVKPVKCEGAESGISAEEKEYSKTTGDNSSPYEQAKAKTDSERYVVENKAKPKGCLSQIIKGCLILFGILFLFILFSAACSSSQADGSESTETTGWSTLKGYERSTTESKTTSFTNEYGTSTTKCAHTGCDNYIARSGDTSYCTTHSNRCLGCDKYIDEDALYCLDCLAEAIDENSQESSHKCEECGKGAAYSLEGLGGDTEYYCAEHYLEMLRILEDLYEDYDS